MTTQRGFPGVYIPTGTVAEEHDLVAPGDIIVCDESTVNLGLRGRTLLLGADCSFGGDIEATGDCYLDPRTTVSGNLVVGRRAGVGDRVRIRGQLRAGTGVVMTDTATVRGGYGTDGTTSIDTPRSAAVYVGGVFLSILRGRSITPPGPLVIPRHSTIGDDRWQFSGPATIGDDCRLHGNIQAHSVGVGTNTTVFGSIEAPAGVDIGPGTEITGDIIVADGPVHLRGDAHVRGDVRCQDLHLSGAALVDGTMRASASVDLRSLTGPGERLRDR